KELLAACLRYIEKAPRELVMFEYVMLEGVNDGVAHARDLAALVKNVPCKINLIPFNSYPGGRYVRSSPAAIERFRDELMQRGLIATVRKTRGDGIAAACGQLAGQVQDKTRRRQRGRDAGPVDARRTNGASLRHGAAGFAEKSEEAAR